MDKSIKQDMPEAPKFSKLIGPSFILLGLGLGSGEVILWPYLVSNWGLGIIWGAVLGITFQFFINMEIERYALIKGESVFVGLSRFSKFFPFWFIFSTLAGFVWPGIILSSGVLIAKVFGFSNPSLFAVGLLILGALILTLGPILYKTMERFSMLLITLGVPILFGIVLYLANTSDWIVLLKGAINFGYLPVGVPLAVFLGAFAFSGAGGNLNLAQSFYIKEKGYGMGKFGGRITSILTGRQEDIKLEGTDFHLNEGNIERFKKWWRLINIEHALVFWLAGVVSIFFLVLLSYVTTFGTSGISGGISFVLHEASSISSLASPTLGVVFLILGGLMLFSTQTTVMDATSRIMSENVLLLYNGKIAHNNLPKIYYLLLWIQVVFGIIVLLLGFKEPLLLLTLSSVINAVAMFCHIGFVFFLNQKTLDKRLKPSILRVLVISIAFLFFGYFSFKVIAGIF